MTTLGPLRFEPLLRRYVWGGRRLSTVLGKPLGEGDDYAESWEICDLGDAQSIVAVGPSRGRTLGELVRQHPRELFGRHTAPAHFPWLFKFLDAHRPLSVQVHPDDATAAELTPPSLGKTEAWIVLEAEPDSSIYAGLKRGFDRAALAREVARGTCELCLHRFVPKPGDCVFLPAGAVHALGEGIVVAEIQTASDTTWRLHDWGRVGADGNPRPLHIDEALSAIDDTLGPISPVVPNATDRPHVERLVACDKFVVDRWHFDAPQNLPDDERFHLLAVLAGEASVTDDPAERSLARGDVTLLPARRAPTTVVPAPGTVMLDMYLP